MINMRSLVFGQKQVRYLSIHVRQTESDHIYTPSGMGAAAVFERGDYVDELTNTRC